MTPEQVFGKLNKDIKGLTSGVASASVSGSSIIFTMNDGSTQTITFPQPKDGASIVAVSTNENNQFVFSMSDGTEIVGGEVPASSGVSKEYVDSELSKKANNSDIPTKVSGLQNDSNYQTDTDVATALTPYAKSTDVTKEITNKVAEIVADAPEDFNTLKEMSDWISNHENDASAMNSAISDNKTAITALQTGKADKSEIPTELPANGGNADTVNNHTVETNVPTDAKFTDTVYDDTEVKESIEGLSSNLVELKVSDTSGGKNLQNVNSIVVKKAEVYITDYLLPIGTYTISFVSNTSGGIDFYSKELSDGIIGGVACQLKENQRVSKTFTVNSPTRLCSYSNITATLTEIQIEEGTTATEYEPYIPSVKMLAEENAQQSSNLDGLEFGEVAGGKNLLNPIWKTSSNNGVNFINNGDGSFTIKGTPNTANSSYSESILIPVEVGKSYKLTGNCISAYKKDNIQSILENNSTTSESTFTATEDAVNICLYVGANTDNIDITSKYMLTEATNTSEYEPYIPSVKALAEEVSAQNESLSVIGKCKNLLNSTLATTTSSGVTCTANGDGTYTLNGTATSQASFEVVTNFSLEKGKKYKMLGCPNGGSESTYLMQYKFSAEQIPIFDTGNGKDFLEIDSWEQDNIWIIVQSGVTVSNLVFKPMITEDLTVTYDDFVPYTGDGDTLTHDVAELKNDLVPKKIELQNVDERVTIQDNGSFIINGFAFVNLLVTFNETLPQWSNFVRLPRPKGGNVSVHCENSVKLTIYSQDNLPGDCGTYDEVSSGTEVRLLVNYEVA